MDKEQEDICTVARIIFAKNREVMRISTYFQLAGPLQKKIFAKRLPSCEFFHMSSTNQNPQAIVSCNAKLLHSIQHAYSLQCHQSERSKIKETSRKIFLAQSTPESLDVKKKTSLVNDNYLLGSSNKPRSLRYLHLII